MKRRFGGHSAVALASAVVCVACERSTRGIVDASSCTAPNIVSSRVVANPYNVLSATVTAQVLDADSVAVHVDQIGASVHDSTPAIKSNADATIIPVLGLLAETPYQLSLVAYGGCGTTARQSLSFTTGALPTDLPQYVASGSDPSRGFVILAAGAYGLVIDNAGRVVWYRRFPAGPGLNFQAQPIGGGRYVARPPTAAGESGKWIELDVIGAETRSFGCARGLSPRFHDLIELADSSVWVMCDETRVLNLSDIGGNAAAKVTGTVIQHVSGTGELLFEWSPFDHFQFTDLDSAARSGATVNWTHGNAFDLDSDDNLVVSFRSLNEITKIATRTGDVLWRMGGRANQFTLQGNIPAFAGQHGLRVAGPSELVLLDNLGVAGQSRAERYVYDGVAHTLRLTASYSSLPAVIAQLGGTTQTLPGGRILVAFGNAGRVEEYDASGQVVWRIEGSPGYVYRAQRIPSLYHPGIGAPR